MLDRLMSATKCLSCLEGSVLLCELDGLVNRHRKKAFCHVCVDATKGKSQLSA